jgi:hypothetical protein
MLLLLLHLFTAVTGTKPNQLGILEQNLKIPFRIYDFHRLTIFSYFIVLEG